MKILVVTSNLPATNESETVPFVRDQIIFMKKNYPELDFYILAPHYNDTKSKIKRKYYTEFRFHYFLPRKYETLAGKGILPALKEKPYRYFLIPFYIISEFFALYRLTKKIKPDYIYAHWFLPQAINAALVSMLTNVPYVFTNHASDISIMKKIPWIGKKIVRYFLKRAHAITTTSDRTLQKTKSFFSDKLWGNVNMEIIPMGIDFTSYTSNNLPIVKLKVKYGLKDNKVLLFMGRLAEKKGVVYLIDAFYEIHNYHPELRLIIAGDGQLRKSLERKVSMLGLTDKIIFVGFLSGEIKKDYLNLADIFVLPSIVTKEGDAEGLPVTLMEALAAGKICIATIESNADYIIENEVSGFLIHEKDSKSLSQAIQKVLLIEDKTKEIMTKKAREAALKLDWNRIVKKQVQFLFNIQKTN